MTFIPGQQWQSTVGTYAIFGPVQRYRHYLAGTWQNGPWTVTLGNNFSSGYDDEVHERRWVGPSRGFLGHMGPVHALDRHQEPGAGRGHHEPVQQHAADHQPDCKTSRSATTPRVASPLGRVYYLTAQYKFL